MKFSHRALLALATTGLAAFGGLTHPDTSTPSSLRLAPSVGVCRASLSETPGSFSDEGVLEVVAMLDAAVAPNANGAEILAGYTQALAQSYPGKSGIGHIEVTYSYVYDPIQEMWIRVCTEEFEGLVFDDPSDPVQISILIPKIVE